MKRTFIFLALVPFTLSLLAQPPAAFNYQAVVRDDQGLVLPDQTVSLKFSIVSGSGVEQYVEEHSIQTGPTGLVNLTIGEGNNASGSLENIDWGTDSYLLNISLDPEGGTNFQHMGQSQLVSVPYALHAGSVDKIGNEEGHVGIGTNEPRAPLDVNGELRFNGNCIDLGTYGDGTVNISRGQQNSYTIYFNKRFSEPPVVTFSLECPNGPCGGFLSEGEQVSQVKEDRFTVFWIDNSGASSIQKINWMAIGPCDTIHYTAGEFTDERDGQSYPYIELNNTTWMAENLNYYTPEGSWYFDDDSAKYAEQFGKLYNWETAQNVCPAGWHLPSQTEYGELITYLGGEGTAGKALKEMGNTYWRQYDEDVEGDNTSRFNGRGGGLRESNGVFNFIKDYGFFWTSTETQSSEVAFIRIQYNGTQVYQNQISESYKARAKSVRCIRD